MWDVNTLVAVLALVLSAVVWLSQRRSVRDQTTLQNEQTELQRRLTVIEEARRNDEVENKNSEQEARVIADVRVEGLKLVIPGPSGASDRLGVKIVNYGPAIARHIALAIRETADRAVSQHLKEFVEPLDEDPEARKGYYAVDAEPLDELLPNSTFAFEFWLRYRVVDVAYIRVAWVDGRGPQVRHQATRLDEYE
jgi:hypothetical protein